MRGPAMATSSRGARNRSSRSQADGVTTQSGFRSNRKGARPTRPEIDAGRESFVGGSFNQLDPRKA